MVYICRVFHVGDAKTNIMTTTTDKLVHDCTGNVLPYGGAVTHLHDDVFLVDDGSGTVHSFVGTKVDDNTYLWHCWFNG